MKTVLFLNLGNRDLQLPPTADLPNPIFNHFDEGNIDSGVNYVIKKNDRRFLEHSQRIYDAYEICKNQVVFPLVEKSIELSCKKVDKIFIITTSQDPLDTQDCHFIALFLEKWLKERKFNVEYIPITFAPIDFGALSEFYTNLYNKFDDQWQIIFGNSGGTPDMRAASHFAGMFRGIKFITIQAREGTSFLKNYQKQEQLVLKHIIEKMLGNYDFAGILSLPVSSNIKRLAEYALSRISLDFEKTGELALKLKNKEFKLPDISQVPKLEQETLLSARIKFHQKAFADYLWRLFTIRDNMLTPYVESLLGGKIEYDRKNGHPSWNQLIAKEDKLTDYLSSRIIMGQPLKYSEPNAYCYDAILDFFEKERGWKRPDLLVKIKKNLDNLAPLRNAIAHYYSGINIEKIEENLVQKYLPENNKNINGLNQILCEYCGVSETDFGIYSFIAKKIIKEISQ